MNFYRVQDLLRQFLPSRADERLRFLTSPVYHTKDTRRIVFAGDGRAFIWTAARGIEGYRDYNGVGMPDVVSPYSIMARWRPNASLPLPPSRAKVQEVEVCADIARIAKPDADRLRNFDSVWIGAGNSRGQGKGWEHVNFRAKWGEHTFDGIVFCV